MPCCTAKAFSPHLSSQEVSGGSVAGDTSSCKVPRLQLWHSTAAVVSSSPHTALASSTYIRCLSSRICKCLAQHATPSQQRHLTVRIVMRACYRSDARLVFALHSRRSGIACVADDGKRIAVGAAELGQLLVWDWRQETYILKQQGHSTHVAAVAFSPDGSQLATAGDDSKVDASRRLRRGR